MRHVREWLAVVLATVGTGVVVGAAVALLAELPANPAAALVGVLAGVAAGLATLFVAGAVVSLLGRRVAAAPAGGGWLRPAKNHLDDREMYWSAWRRFPGFRTEGHPEAPDGPRVYELRNRSTGELRASTGSSRTWRSVAGVLPSAFVGRARTGRSHSATRWRVAGVLPSASVERGRMGVGRGWPRAGVAGVLPSASLSGLADEADEALALFPTNVV